MNTSNNKENTTNALDQKRWLIPIVIAIAMFIDTLDSTIISVAIPSIAESFNIDPVAMKLALTCYLLSLAVFIPISGWIADRYGEKNVFITAITIFTLSSIWCAASPNLPSLIIARTVQGFGGALMMPVGRLIMLRNFSKTEYANAMTLVIAPGLIGPALGPTLGGLILSVASWHWIFLVNIPFGIIEILLAYYYIKPTARQATTTFNWLGFLLFSIGLVQITLALALLGDDITFLPSALLFLTLAIVFLFMYWKVSSKQANPLLDTKLFKQNSFNVAALVSLVARPFPGAFAFLLPLLLQILWGKSPLFSGSASMFLALGMISTRFFFGQRWINYYGFKKVMAFCVVALTILSMNLCWFATPQPFVYLVLLLFIIGLLTSQLYMCIGLLSVLEIESNKFSQATSIISTIQQFSAGCGIAVAAIILHVTSIITSQPVFSTTVFFWTIIIFNSLTLFSLIFIMKLDPTLKIESTKAI